MKKHRKAIDYFNRHHRNECYITSDGRVFHKKGQRIVLLLPQKIEQ